MHGLAVLHRVELLLSLDGRLLGRGIDGVIFDSAASAYRAIRVAFFAYMQYGNGYPKLCGFPAHKWY
ncbi:hypothetical protein [Rubrivivax albus]|uniref:Uncharacterized protein n=1 Tax=Rubrivivax albus TaxID=2499835 RepID=A0A437JXE6_9BURK|nr:hypothetical protein [Rubrivivax albus]RVT52275.1 hypothetical protein ENE75_07405 [Rubrivivax albus]